MARYFTAASSQRLVATGIAFRQDSAITMALWAKRDAAVFQWLMKYYHSGGTSNHHMIGFRNTAVYRARSNGSAIATAETSGTNDDGRWHHVAGVFTSGSLRYSFADGVTAGADTGSVTTAGLNSISIGAQEDGSDAYEGALAETAIWRTALSATELRNLAGGISALFVRPDKLAFYAPLWGAEDFDIVGGVSLSSSGSGSPGVRAHPRIVYPAGFEVRSVGRSVVKPSQIGEQRRRNFFSVSPGGVPAPRRVLIDDATLVLRS